MLKILNYKVLSSEEFESLKEAEKTLSAIKEKLFEKEAIKDKTNEEVADMIWAAFSAHVDKASAQVKMDLSVSLAEKLDNKITEVKEVLEEKILEKVDDKLNALELSKLNTTKENIDYISDIVHTCVDLSKDSFREKLQLLEMRSHRSLADVLKTLKDQVVMFTRVLCTKLYVNRFDDITFSMSNIKEKDHVDNMNSIYNDIILTANADAILTDLGLYFDLNSIRTKEFVFATVIEPIYRVTYNNTAKLYEEYSKSKAEFDRLPIQFDDDTTQEEAQEIIKNRINAMDKVLAGINKE